MLASFVIASIGTVLVTLAVWRGWSARTDAWLLDRLRHRPAPRADGKPARSTAAMRDLTALGGDTLRTLFVLACLFGLIADRRAATGWTLIAISICARLALFAVKRIVRRARPDAGPQGLATYTSSFPSGHTFLAVTVYLSAAILIPIGASPQTMAAGIASALLLAAAIGTTRVAFGIHWPSDVLAGWCLGIAWVTGCVLIPGGSI